MTIKKRFCEGGGEYVPKRVGGLNQYYIFWCLEEEEIIELGKLGWESGLSL